MTAVGTPTHGGVMLQHYRGHLDNWDPAGCYQGVRRPR